MTFDGDVNVDPTVVVGLDDPDPRNSVAPPPTTRACPLNVIVDHEGGGHVHVAVKDDEYDKVNGYDQACKDVTNRRWV